jgi:3-oxoacyl-[acyl-carrier-protein] synthase-3
MKTVYINDVAAFLPNLVVANDEMDAVLGNETPGHNRVRQLILRQNGIKTRYYAIDPRTGAFNYTNAALTAEAVRRLSAFSTKPVECLCCGTSSPDQSLPGHALMVQGELQTGPCETASFSGICGSGMSAMKYAFLTVASSEASHAVATGSELSSLIFRAAARWSEELDLAELERNPGFQFQAQFLRWMLSDGAGAVWMSGVPNADKPSLRVDWIDQVSYAHELEACMYMDALKDNSGQLTGWRRLACEKRNDPSWMACLQLQQDVKLLNRHIVEHAVDHALRIIAARRKLDVRHVDWFLPHYSSDYFRKPLLARLKDAGFEIPESKWFTNLSTKGNTGAASIYIMLEELFHSGWLQPGQKLLCFVPESGRFTFFYMMLTVV